MSPLAIYIHWPFCLSKCNYCAFYSIVADGGLYEPVVDKIIDDLVSAARMLGKRSVVSIFFGGGTPSLLRPQDICKIVDVISSRYDCSDDIEITLEANPDTLNKTNIKDFKGAGINRLSVGVQSFNDDELSFLGRRCNADVTLKAAELARAHFDNYSFDIIYGFSKQSRLGLERTLLKALSFDVPHLSCYKLTFEEGTKLYNLLQAGSISDISNDEDEDLSHMITDILSSYQLRRYETSNYSKPGFESIHNCAYWKYLDYLGIGPAAHSRLTVDGYKCSSANISDIKEWLDSGMNFTKLSYIEMCEEAIIMGLRTIYGVDEKYISERIRNSKQFQKFMNDGVLELFGDRIRIQEKFLNLCDYIISEILD